MTWLLSEVVRHGTATAALRLKAPHAGKTGTTNDYTDAWFIGFSPSITCGVWIGFDEKKPLGKDETGGRTALPIWMDFMRVAIADPARRSETFRPRMNTPPAVAARKRMTISLSRASARGEVR